MKHSGETTFTVGNKIIGYADEIQGEYVMRFMDPMPKLHALAKPTKDLRTWHGRVAHLGYKNLIRMSKYVFGMEEVAGPVPNEICGWCMMGRQQQEISRVPMTRSEIFLDLLHFDLEGPLPKTFRGYRYFLLVKDDSTALMFLKPLRSKGEAFGELLQLKTYLELQSGKRWRRGRSDWGGEFNSTKSIQWFKDNGVAWEPSAPYTPQQNGKAERSMYTIMSAVRSIMSEKRLPKSLWDEIAAAVVHVRNRCPSVEGKTPFEKCNNQLPDIFNLRVLCYRAWVLISDIISRTIMNLRAWQIIMVGYEAAN